MKVICSKCRRRGDRFVDGRFLCALHAKIAEWLKAKEGR